MSAKKSIRKISVLFALLFFAIELNAQFTITGPTCVTAGTQYAYTISGSWTNATNMQWCVTNGVITGGSGGCRSGTPLPQVFVTWNSASSGTLSLSTTNPNGSANKAVTISTTLVAGTISNTSQTINYNTLPATLNCSVATGGNCAPAYTYQW